MEELIREVGDLVNAVGGVVWKFAAMIMFRQFVTWVEVFFLFRKLDALQSKSRGL
ncbi:hypothetical protein ES705_15206 [subsurface metagenome]